MGFNGKINKKIISLDLPNVPITQIRMNYPMFSYGHQIGITMVNLAQLITRERNNGKVQMIPFSITSKGRGTPLAKTVGVHR